jgi:aarF domain-containing kinase
MAILCSRILFSAGKVATSGFLIVNAVVGAHEARFKPLSASIIDCQQLHRPIVPLNLKIRPVSERHILFRFFRAVFRFGWICLKMFPAFFAAPLACVSNRFNRVWWDYVVYALATSGPTAIKLAQWVGTRPDLFPKQAVKALSRFHMVSIPEYGLEKTKQDLDSVYGHSWREWLELLDDAKLVGSGAIAHVSRGRLISGPHAGTEVALKIAHRGVREVVEADLDIMGFFGWIVSHVPSLTSLDVPGAVSEFGKFMRSQTNLLTEADNINRFTVLFRDKPDVKFPKVFFEYCTSDILVESYERGIPLGKIIDEGSVRLKKKVCDLGIGAFLKMLFMDNFVHGDLHPGNVMFQPTNHNCSLSELNAEKQPEGTILIIDCGLIAQLGTRDERNFLDLMHAVITGRSHDVGRLMIERSRSPPDTVYRAPEFCDKVAKLVERTVTGKSLLFGAVEFGAVITQLLDIARQHRVRLETDFVSVACALIVLEGVGKQLDPRRNLLWEAEPYILRQFLRRAKEIVISPKLA